MGCVVTERPLKPGVHELLADSFVLAADLGQSNDFTALAVIHHRRTSHLTLKGKETPAGEFFDVRYLARLPLGLSYVEQVDRVRDLLARPPLNMGAELVVDETGVGRAVADLFDGGGLKPTRVTITAGNEQSNQGRGRWHVAKGRLISALDARLHTGELRFAAELAEAGTMAAELKDFRRRVSAAGRYTYSAREAAHDDLVLAVAIGLWWFVGRPPPPKPAVGSYSYSYAH